MVKKRILLGLGACLRLTSLTNSAGYQLMAEIGHRTLYAVAAQPTARWRCVSCLAHTFSHMLAADTDGKIGPPGGNGQRGSEMSGERASGPDWAVVDEGWGRKAVDFATLSEPANCREYVALHHMLGIDTGDRLLDVACGAGLAIELACVRGADCAGIDASARLVAVARDRSPRADIRVGDMHALPWDDGGFTVVTSFRGIWGTTPAAMEEVCRVLRPGGRVGLTVWGHLKVSPGAWALAPFRLAAEPKVANQAAMVALGRPGRGEELLARCGFVDVQRRTIPFAWEFADPGSFARALASTGPAYEAIQHVGEPAFTADGNAGRGRSGAERAAVARGN